MANRTVACPVKRARSTFVATVDGRSGRRKVFAKCGRSIKVTIAALTGWSASEATAHVT